MRGNLGNFIICSLYTFAISAELNDKLLRRFLFSMKEHGRAVAMPGGRCHGAEAGEQDREQMKKESVY